MIIIANIWEIVQDHKIQIQKFIESNIEFFFLTSAAAAAVVTHSQSQAADSQATVAEDLQSTIQQKSVEFTHFLTADQKIFTAALIIYKNKLKIYNHQ